MLYALFLLLFTGVSARDTEGDISANSSESNVTESVLTTPVPEETRANPLNTEKQVITFNGRKITIQELRNTLSRSNTDCPYPNTRGYVGYSTACDCLEGYERDYPIKDRGCWTCNQTCHIHAICEYPGICRCRHGWVGDGISSCEIPLIELASITPLNSSDTLPLTLSVTFHAANDFVPLHAYCKFNGQHVVSGLMEPQKQTIKCLIPTQVKVGIAKVAISADGQTFTNDREFQVIQGIVASHEAFPNANIVTYNIKLHGRLNLGWRIITLLVVITAGILVNFLRVLNANKRKAESEELAPLIPSGHKKRKDLLV